MCFANSIELSRRFYDNALTSGGETYRNTQCKRKYKSKLTISLWSCVYGVYILVVCA